MSDWDKIVGHKNLIAHLKKAVANNRPNHAYIFCGDDGMGKKMVASTFAKSLLCTGEGEKPCCSCVSCLQFENHNQPDIKYVTHEKTMIGVDDIREQIVAEMSIRPYSSKYKIFIVDEAEKMNEAAQNALLKTFEEPPEYGIIILISKSSEAMLETIRSRSVMLPFMAVRIGEVEQLLMKELSLPDYAAHVIATMSQGAPGLALRMASDEEYDDKNREATDILKKIGELSYERIIEISKAWAKDKPMIEFFQSMISIWIRDVLCMKATGKEDLITFAGDIKTIKAQANDLSYEKCSKILAAVEDLRLKLQANVNTEICVEEFLLHLS